MSRGLNLSCDSNSLNSVSGSCNKLYVFFSRNKRRVEARQEQVKVVVEEEEEDGEDGEEKRKYKRLEHDIKIRGEIRSR